MYIKVKISTENAKAWLSRYGDTLPPRGMNALHDALRDVSPMITESVRANVAASLRVQRAVFKKSYYAKPNKIGDKVVLKIGSGVVWAWVHESGLRFSKRLLIPFVRIGYKSFKIAIEKIRAGGGYFVKGRNATILMARHGTPLPRGAAFRRRYRIEKGLKKVPKRSDIPFGVLVSGVVLTPKTKVFQTVMDKMPIIIKTIETRLEGL